MGLLRSVKSGLALGNATLGCSSDRPASMATADQSSLLLQPSGIRQSVTSPLFRCKLRRFSLPTFPRSAVAFLPLLITIMIVSPPLVGTCEPMQFEGSLTLDFLNPTFAPPEFRGSNVAIVLSAGNPSALGTLRLRGGLTDTATVLVTDPEAIANQIFAARLTAGIGIGTLAPFQPRDLFGSQLTQGALPVRGLLRLCLLNNSCDVSIPIPLSEQNGARGIGVGGLIAVSALSGSANISITSAPWTVGTATLPVATTAGSTVTAFAFGFVHGPNSFTATTATTGGVVHLVTPIATVSNQGTDLSGFGRLTVRLVPEPGRLLSVLSGLICLAALYRIRSPR